MADRDLVAVHLEYIREGIDSINAHLEQLNGRTRKLESVVAVHSWAIGIGGVGAVTVIGYWLSKL